MDKNLLKDAFNRAENLITEFEHAKNMIDTLELGFANDHYDDKNLEVSSVHVLGCYIDRLRIEYAQEISDTLRAVVKEGCFDHANNEI